MNWSPVQNSNEEHYTHITLDTPIGQMIIEWKSWKEYPIYDLSIDGTFIDSATDLDTAKDKAGEYLRSKLAGLQEFLSPKRTPLIDGTLPLTAEEIKQLEWIMGMHSINRVFIGSGWLWYRMYGHVPSESLTNIKGILYLNKLFKLTGEN